MMNLIVGVLCALLVGFAVRTMQAGVGGRVEDGTGCTDPECVRRASGLYALNAERLETGETVSLSAFRGMAVLVVNVASECGYTDANYKALQAAYDELKTRQFAVLAFPCNQFGAQEPGSPSDIRKFVESEKYSVTFPVFGKVDVNGPNTHPVWKFLKNSDKFQESDIKWNFEKFLVGPTGEVVKHYGSNAIAPDELKTDVLKCLKDHKRIE